MEIKDFCSILKNDKRLKIVELLMDGKEYSVTEIHETLGFNQTTTSHHLSHLRDQGIVHCRRDKKTRYHYIDKDFRSTYSKVKRYCPEKGK